MSNEEGSGGRRVSCGTLSERVPSCYLYDSRWRMRRRGWRGKRVDQIKVSKVAPFQRGEGERGGEKKEETRDYAPTEPGTQLLRYYFTPSIESLSRSECSVSSIHFFPGLFVDI